MKDLDDEAAACAVDNTDVPPPLNGTVTPEQLHGYYCAWRYFEGERMGYPIIIEEPGLSLLPLFATIPDLVETLGKLNIFCYTPRRLVDARGMLHQLAETGVTVCVDLVVTDDELTFSRFEKIEVQ
jgi:hypothetical protein